MSLIGNIITEKHINRVEKKYYDGKTTKERYYKAVDKVNNYLHLQAEILRFFGGIGAKTDMPDASGEHDAGQAKIKHKANKNNNSHFFILYF